MEACRHHIAELGRLDGVKVLGEVCQVAVRIIDVEELAEDTVLKVGELPSCQHTTAVHRVAGLSLERVPVRSDGRHDDPVTGLEVLDQLAYLDHLGTALVAEDHIVAIAYGALPEGVYVAGADGYSEWPTDGVHGTTLGDRLLDPACLPDPEHCVSFHDDR